MNKLHMKMLNEFIGVHFCQEEEAKPRRGGQGPGRLPGKINEAT